MVLPWCYGLRPVSSPAGLFCRSGHARAPERTVGSASARRPGAPQTPGFLAVTISEESMWRM